MFELDDVRGLSSLNNFAILYLLQEVERNLQDAMQVCRNVLMDPQLVPGGGATEMAVSHALTERSKGMTGVEQWPYRAVAQALEVIPRTLIQNCGASTIRVLTSLRVRHVAGAPGELLYPAPWISHHTEQCPCHAISNMFFYKLESILMTYYSFLSLWSILRFQRGICHLTPLVVTCLSASRPSIRRKAARHGG